MNRIKYQIQYVPINKLSPAEFNSRTNTEKQALQLDTSIERFDLIDPLIVNSAPKRKNIIIGGHFRWREAKKLGYKEVPCIFVNIPDIEREKELNLRLNSNVGQWDLEKLFKEFDIEMTIDVGLDDQLEQYWDQTLSVEVDEFNVDDELKKIKTPVTKPGDFLKLGNHYLFCHDSGEITNVKRLCNGEKISVIYCDPPFNNSLNYDTGIGTKGKYGGKTDDNKSDEDYRAFLKKTIENAIAVSKPDFHIFYYCDESYIWLLQSLYRELGIDNKRVCLWVKNSQNPTPQVAFSKCYEAVVYGVHGAPYLSPGVTNLNEIFNREITTGNRLPDDILDLFNIWLVKRLPGQNYTHPTEKPASLHEKALRRCSKPGDAILDLFAGSGSLMVACEALKRRAFLCEREPIFCDLIIKRFKNLTGKEVVHVNSKG